MIIRDIQGRMDGEEIVGVLNEYYSSDEYKLLEIYDQFYKCENPAILDRYKDKKRRNVRPNHVLPSAYYQSLSDSIAGYMFSDIDYKSEDEKFNEELNTILFNNNQPIKDMDQGIRAVAYNKGVEMVYTVGDENAVELKFSTANPLKIIPIYDGSIEPELLAAIRIIRYSKDDKSYVVEVIYKDIMERWEIENNAAKHLDEDRVLLFDEVPVVIYKTQSMISYSQLHCIIPYLDALDVLLSGNSNDTDRISDAILLLSNVVSPEDAEKLNEMRVLDGVKKDDRAEYITKDMSPEFKKYVSELLISEIYKHAHVPNWHQVSGSGAESAKALRTKLFDMSMMANRSEKVFREGCEKRLRLISTFMSKKMSLQPQPVEIIFHREVPSEFEEKAPVVNSLTFVSDETKMEMLGIDPEIEKERRGAEMSVEPIE